MMSETCWTVKIFTLFPEMFPGSLGFALAQKAYQDKIWNYQCINYRDFACDAHKTVDDVPYGGGAGMVIKPDVLGKALDMHCNEEAIIYYPSPRGRVFDMAFAEEMVHQKEVAFVCGRYEGVDQRVMDHYRMQEVSIGDYILSGGEVAVQVMMDACIRLLPGSLGNMDTHQEESFSNGLLEYPHYTRPRIWKGYEVPEILISGHHEKIKAWRLKESECLTSERRPDLWKKYKKD